MRIRVIGFGLAMLVAWLAAGCGGDGEADNTAPVARVSATVRADAGSLVVISGTGSSDADGDALSYQWTLSAPIGSQSALTGSNTVSPTFTPDVVGDYALSLTVNDGRVSSPAVSATVSVELGAADRAAAVAAALTATVDATTRSLTLIWNDSFPSGTLFRVEARSPAGNFIALETLASAGAVRSWQRGSAGFTDFRVLALAPGRTVELLSATGRPTLNIAASASVTPPAIVAAAAEPLSGTVRLSLTQDLGSSSVEWFSGQRTLGSGSGDSDRGLNWDTTLEGAAGQTVRARLQLAPDVFLEVQRNFVLDNVMLATAVTVGTDPDNSQIQWVDVDASAPGGIEKVELRALGSFYGNSVFTQRQPLCSTAVCPSSGRYRFVLTNIANDYTLAILVYARSDPANPRAISVPVVVPAAPRVSLDFSFPSVQPASLLLPVRFRIDTSDRPGPVTVTLTLGDRILLQTRYPGNTTVNESPSFDVSSFPPGRYRLALQALDSSGAANVVAQSVLIGEALSAPVVLTLPPASLFATADKRRLLYQDNASGVWKLFDIASNTTVPLADTDQASFKTDWRIDGGFAYAGGTGAGCARNCIYQWNTLDGSVVNLSNASPFSTSTTHPSGRSSDALPWARGGFVLWHVGDQGHLVLYEVATRRYTRIADPQGRTILPAAYSLAATGGVAKVVFTTRTGSGTGNGTFVQKWSSDSGAVTPLTADNANSSNPKTDGETVAWHQGTELLMQSFAGGPVTTLATQSNDYALADGVVAWHAFFGRDAVIRARRTVNPTVTLNTVVSPRVFGTGGGQVVFTRFGRTYSWNSSTGVETERLPFDFPALHFGAFSGSTLYLLAGQQVLEFKLD